MLLYGRNHRCEGLRTQVLLRLPKTDPEYCLSRIAVKEPEVLVKNSAQNPRSVRLKTSVQSSKKQRKLQKNPGTTVGVSSNIRRPKINEEVYRDYEKLERKNFPPPWGKTAGVEQGKEFFVTKNKLCFFLN